MKTLFLLAAGAAALLAPAARAQDATPPGAPPTVGAPPQAGPVLQGGGNWTLQMREKWLDDHINKAHDARDITGREADRAHHDLDRIRDDESHMRGAHGGELTDNETSVLEARLDQMASQIQWAHQNAYQRPW